MTAEQETILNQQELIKRLYADLTQRDLLLKKMAKLIFELDKMINNSLHPDEIPLEVKNTEL